MSRAKAMPQREKGRYLMVIEPTGALLSPWKGRLVQERRWISPRGYPGSWEMSIIYPNPRRRTDDTAWVYRLTRSRLEKKLQKEAAKKMIEDARRQAREYVPVEIPTSEH